MTDHRLLYVNLPTEFIGLLKLNLNGPTTILKITEVISKSPALYLSLGRALKEFDDGRGLEKTLVNLSWPNLRDRMAGFYIFKYLHGNFPHHTNTSVVNDIRKFENRFLDYSTNGSTRAFLLGFYLRFCNLKNLNNSDYKEELFISDEIDVLLKLSQMKVDKIDWMILILSHLNKEMGFKNLLNSLSIGRKFDDLYLDISPVGRKDMFNNLLAYGASINEPDFFVSDLV